MTKKSRDAVIAAEASTRRKAARPRLVLAIPLIAFLVYRIMNLGDVTAEAWLWALAVMVPITLFACLFTYLAYRRKLRRVAALVGHGGWSGVCSDPDNPRQWQALIIDAAGVRTFDPSGEVGRQWKRENIRDVTVERIPVELITLSAAVMHLVDGSRAELLLASPLGPFTARRARVAANEIRGRLYRSVPVPPDDGLTRMP